MSVGHTYMYDPQDVKTDHFSVSFYTVEELKWNFVPFLFSMYDPQDVKTEHFSVPF